MGVSDDFASFVCDQLSGWARVSVRKMFGGAGLYRDGLMFGLIADDVAYLKVDDSTRRDFVKAGSEPFRPYGGKKAMTSYYQVPPDVLEDPDAFCEWARKANEAATKGKEKKRSGV
jgi:DNA transformation protein